MEKTYTKTRLRLMLAFIALAFHVSAQGLPSIPSGEQGGELYRLVELKAERLPSLNIARAGHETFCLDGELTVFGGHTDGFIPTATAEYLHDGVWQTLPLAYPHDQGVAVRLRSGKVFLAGGHKEPLGIDQLFSAELYDPASHASQGFGCMARKRAFANGIEMADGQVLISGNWFAGDGMEMFANVADPRCTNAVEVKETALARAKPYILRVSDDDVIIFSSLDNKANPVDYGTVDRLKGPSYREPFLYEWHPLHTIYVRRSMNHFIGNEAEGCYAWLLPVENDETGQVAIARVEGPKQGEENATFSLLPTAQPLPDSIDGKHIIYSSLVCDRERSLAYLIGDDDEARIFVVCIPYDTPEPSPLTVYVTEPQPILAQSATPVLTPEGNLVFAGGYLHSNFSPSNTVILLPLGHAYDTAASDPAADADSGSRARWLWIAVPCLLACAVGVVLMLKKRRKSATNAGEAESVTPAETQPSTQSRILASLETLMRDEKLYLQPDLRLTDVAERLGIGRTNLSTVINQGTGQSFSDYINTFRVSHAQEILRSEQAAPTLSVIQVAEQSGFTSESSFYRAFRKATGMTPKQWLANATQ